MDNVTPLIDTALDRSVVLGYSNIGWEVRRLLPGWPADPPRMDGKVVLVTGAGSGIGLAAAAGFARLGATVHALGRSEERAARAVAQAREQAGGGDVRPAVCDVSSLAGLGAFITEFCLRAERLDVLVNNAGVMPGERTLSADGVELMFATHVLAPWVLTSGLLPLLRAAAPSRVINVTSGGQYAQGIPGGDLESARDSYGPKKIYARTKREQVVLTQEQAAELAADGVHVHAMHPGWADTAGVQRWMPVFRAVTRPFIRTAEQGADTIVWLGAAPEGIRTTGLLWQDRRPRPATYRFGAGPDSPGAARELRDHLARLTSRVSG